VYLSSPACLCPSLVTEQASLSATCGGEREFSGSPEQQLYLFDLSPPLRNTRTLETVVWREILRIASLADAQCELRKTQSNNFRGWGKGFFLKRGGVSFLPFQWYGVTMLAKQKNSPTVYLLKYADQKLEINLLAIHKVIPTNTLNVKIIFSHAIHEHSDMFQSLPDHIQEVFFLHQ